MCEPRSGFVREEAELPADIRHLTHALRRDVLFELGVPAVELEHTDALDHLAAPRHAEVGQRHATRTGVAHLAHDGDVGGDEAEEYHDAHQRGPARKAHQQEAGDRDDQRRRPQLVDEWQRVQELLRVVGQQVGHGGRQIRLAHVQRAPVDERDRHRAQLGAQAEVGEELRLLGQRADDAAATDCERAPRGGRVVGLHAKHELAKQERLRNLRGAVHHENQAREDELAADHLPRAAPIAALAGVVAGE